MTGTAHIMRADARHLPLADDTVDLVVTSPPYFALRSYQDGGEHYDGQIGDEATPAEFVDALLEVTRECVRVLKPSGSLWVNLGDKYSATSTPGPQSQNSTMTGGRHKGVDHVLPRRLSPGAPPKSLIGIPWRYAIRCIDELGLILRAEVVWSKPNGLPESVTDRVRRSHEQWFCFEQSGGVESAAQSFPFCPLCGRPVDARATLVRRLKECESSIEPGDVAHHVRTDARSDGADARSGHDDVAVGPLVPPVPALGERDVEVTEDALDLGQDRLVAAVDGDAQDRAALPADEGHGALAVNESGEPSRVCECEGHALIIDDEPWLPQSLAAEIMQRVADGEIDPQQAADFLSGDYVRNHSVWFHFTLQPRYYSAVDEIREDYSDTASAKSMREWQRKVENTTAHFLDREQTRSGGQSGLRGPDMSDPNPLGKLPGSVWTIPTEPLIVPDELGVDHFAAFPTEWPRRIIQGWSPAGVCVECGEGRRPVASVTPVESKPFAARQGLEAGRSWNGNGGNDKRGLGYAASDRDRTITGYACACPDTSARTTPGIVLDPFGGTGTTALVAKALGRHGISVDMSADYCRLAQWRTNDPAQLAKAARKPHTPSAKPIEGQSDLLDLLAEESA